MINLSDVATGLLGLGVIAAAVGLVAVGGRDRTADQHDLSDYHEPDEVTPRAERLHRQDPAGILPPAPAGADGGSPLYVETLFRTWYPDAPADVAARMLREIAAEESDDVIWNRATDRDMTGAFPVVRAA